MKKSIHERGLQHPLNIPKAFYEDLKKIKGKSSMGEVITTAIEIYQKSPQPISFARVPDKNKELFKQKYSFYHTSLLIRPLILQQIHELFPEEETNSVINRLLYLYCQSTSNGYYFDYFEDDYFKKHYLFNIEDYQAAYLYAKAQGSGNLTQRLYGDVRVIEHPTLHNIRKNFGSFLEFVKLMDNLSK